MSTKRSLGKGLNALIPGGSSNSNDRRTVEEIHLGEIRPNKDQPRKSFDDESIRQLSSSIMEHGIVQPIVVTRTDDYYQIVAGERRWRAAQAAGLDTIPCIVKEYSEEVVAKIALVENLQREDLNDIEEAVAYQMLMERFSLTQEKISEAVGKSRSHIANTMRLLKLDDQVKSLVIDGHITGGHARALLRVDNPIKQMEFADRVRKHGLSVRDIENLVSKDVEKTVGVKKSKSRKADGEIVTVENRLKELLSTKVSVKHGKDKGKIEIEYYGDEDLNRILQLILLKWTKVHLFF